MTQLNITIGGVALLAFGVLVLYGEAFANHRFIVEMRRYAVWVMPKMPGPSSTAIAGAVPAGAALLLGSVGRAVAGETATLEGFPWSVGQNLMILAMILFCISLWFMLRPPAWALPLWYRDFLARRRAGLEPDMPKPRRGSELIVTRTQFRIMVASLIVLVAAVIVLDLPPSWTIMAFLGLASLRAYTVHG